MILGDRQRLGDPKGHSGRDVFGGGLWKRQASEGVLDRDLPGAGRGEEALVVHVLDCLPRMLAEPFRLAVHPEPAMGIQEDPHRSNSSSSSSGSRWSKSSGTWNRPRSVPRRTALGSETGTRRATGRPALAITTSSPRATCRKRRERWVLASCTFTVFMGIMID